MSADDRKKFKQRQRKEAQRAAKESEERQKAAESAATAAATAAAGKEKDPKEKGSVKKAAAPKKCASWSFRTGSHIASGLRPGVLVAQQRRAAREGSIGMYGCGSRQAVAGGLVSRHAGTLLHERWYRLQPPPAGYWCPVDVCLLQARPRP